MPVNCFTLMRRIAERGRRRLGRVFHRVSRHVPRRFHRAALRGLVWRRPTAIPVKVCVATGLAGLGAAGLVAGGLLTLAPTDSGLPRTMPEPPGRFAPKVAGGSFDPGLAFDPAKGIAAADPTIPFDPGEPTDPSIFLGFDDPGSAAPPDPSGTGDPADPRDSTPPRNRPAQVPEPSSALILGMALSGAALWRKRLTQPMARH